MNTTNTLKHSCGPWSVSGKEIISPERYVATVYDWSTGKPIAAQYQDIEDALKAESEANAKLIAAAPDMLEALQYIVAWNPTDWSPEKARDLAGTAIAKATA